MRVGEMLDLELGCLIDFAGHGAWLKVPVGKLGTERMVPLEPATLTVIDAWMAHRGEQRAIPHPRTGQPVNFLFLEHGARPTGFRLRQGLRQAVASAGLRSPGGAPPGVTPHTIWSCCWPSPAASIAIKFTLTTWCEPWNPCADQAPEFLTCPTRMRRTTRAHAFTVMIAPSLAAVGLAACGTSAAPGGSPLSSTSASRATTSALPTTGGTVTPVMAPPITALATIRSSPPGPPVVGRSILTKADSGITIQLPVGQKVTVVLESSSVMMLWGQPAAQGGAAVRVSASGGYPSSLPARAVFKAVRPGTAQLTSWTDAKCLHLPEPQKCLPAQQLWQVRVIVPAGCAPAVAARACGPAWAALIRLSPKNLWSLTRIPELIAGDDLLGTPRR